MNAVNLKKLFQKLSQLYIAKFLEKKVLQYQLNKEYFNTLKGHNTNSEIVVLNTQLTDAGLLLERLVDIFERASLY